MRASKGWVTVLVVVLACAGAANAITSSNGQDCSRCVAWGHSLLWGAWFDDSVPWNLGPVQSFERSMGQRMSVIQFGQPWANCSGRRCFFYGFNRRAVRTIWSRGAIPMISWGSESIPQTNFVNEPDFRLSRVASGAYDSFVRRWALAAKRWGHPLLMRFDWEMNGDWFPWGTWTNHNTPSDFVAAWRHVHDIFTSVGASSVTWVWCPNINNKWHSHVWWKLDTLYPGDGYVDWTCLDGYNFGPVRAGGRWASFDSLFHSTYDQVASHVAPDKPMLLGEVASVGRGGSRPNWIAGMFGDLPGRYPLIHGVVWFQRRDGVLDWPIPPGSSSARAFAAGVRRNQSHGALCPHMSGALEPPVHTAADCG